MMLLCVVIPLLRLFLSNVRVQVCNKCVRRLDHHCPAILNCVGEGNQRQFTAYIYNMVLTQVSDNVRG